MERMVVEEDLKAFLGEKVEEKETEKKARELAEKFLSTLREAGGEVRMRETEGAYVVEAKMPDGATVYAFMRRFQGMIFDVGAEKKEGLLELDAKDLPNNRRIFVKGMSKIHSIAGEIADLDDKRLANGSILSNNELSIITKVKKIEIVISKEFQNLMISM